MAQPRQHHPNQIESQFRQGNEEARLGNDCNPINNLALQPEANQHSAQQSRRQSHAEERHAWDQARKSPSPELTYTAQHNREQEENEEEKARHEGL